MLLTLACATILATDPAAQTSQVADPLHEHVAKLASEVVGKRGCPGVAIGLIADGKQRVFAFGRPSMKSERAIDGDTLFEIGSITKVFTCIALAQMTLDGSVRLEDTVQGLLPDTVAMPRTEEREIRLVDMATHHSGLPRMPSNFHPKNGLNPFASYTVDKMYESLGDHELRRDVGEEYEYSNLAMGLLGHVLARRAGTDYETLISRRLLQPLGMRATGIELNEELRPRLARAHLRNGIATLNWDFPTLTGAGALRSSVHDMMKFLNACLSPPDKTFAAALELTMKPRHEIAKDISVGLGWHVEGAGDGRWWWHDGATGGYTSYAGFNPKRQMAVVVLRNRQHGGPGPSPGKLGEQIVKYVLAQER